MVDYKVELRIDDDWQDITSDVRDSEPLSMMRGRRDWAATTDPSTLSLRLNNGASKVSQGQLGRYSPRNPRSDLYGKIGRNTRIRVIPQGSSSARFEGEVSEWPMRWDMSGNDLWVSIKASGVLRRLGKASSPLSSAIHRFILDNSPLEYWPLTDGPESADQARSEVGGSNFRFLLRDPTIPTGLIFTRPEWQDAEPAPWLEPIARISGTRGIARGAVRSGSTTSWSAVFMRFGLGGIDSFNVVTQSGQTRDTWFVGEDPTVNPREIFVSLLTEELDAGTSSIALLGTATPEGDLFDDNPHLMDLQVTADGSSDLDWTLYLDGEVLLSGSRAVPSLPVRQIQYEWWVQDDGVSEHIGLGHLAVWATGDAPGFTFVPEAMRGFAGETAGRRIERLCDEESVGLLTTGDLDETTPMGPQRVAPFLELLREAEQADSGVLGEQQFNLRLTYRTRENQYNNDPSLVLDYTHGVIAEPFEPVDDDQLLANDITVEREEGGIARAEETDGPVSTQDPPNGVGRYDKSVTLNVETDRQLPSQAGWRLHLGTIDEARFPTLRLDLRNPRVEQFVDEVLGVDLGDIIRIDNPPEWLPPGPYKLFVEAIAEEKTAVTHYIEFTCTPGRVWDVLELGDGELGRLDTGGSTLDESIDADDTVFDVVTQPGSQRWIDSTNFASQFPFDVKVGGEVMRVTAATLPGSISEVGDGDALATDDTDAVAPSVNAPGDADLLVCSWISWDDAGVVWTVPGSMTEQDQTSGTWSRFADGTEVLTSPGATGTRTATRTVADRWAALSVVLSDSSGMTPTIEEHLAGADGASGDVDLTTSASTEAGWVMLAMHGHDNGRSGLPAAPSGGGWTLVADSGLVSADAPVLAVYAKRITSPGAEVVTFQGGGSSDDNQARLYVLSGTVAQQFTVTRSINGIVKPHSVGASLSLALPTVLAL